MKPNFEKLINGTGKEDKINIENADEIFKMFDDFNVTLAGETRDIISEATTAGYITRENLEKLLELIRKSETIDE
jgi:hypothetical protein